MHPDPLMPASHRFPRSAILTGGNQEPPTTEVRPFVLRGALPGGLREAKHRTPVTQTKHTQPTTSDGKNSVTKTDTFTTPDT